MADFPPCPNCNSEGVRDTPRELLGENDIGWLFGCKRCWGRYVVTRSESDARESHQKRLRERVEAEQCEKASGARPIYFT